MDSTSFAPEGSPDARIDVKVGAYDRVVRLRIIQISEGECDMVDLDLTPADVREVIRRLNTALAEAEGRLSDSPTG